jgi:hypothetical protein
MNKEIISADTKELKISDHYTDLEVEARIKEKYDFDAAFFPEGYNMAFLLINDDKNDSKNDIWKVLFFTKRKKVVGTITLDNAEDLANATADEVDILKEVDGNFEDIISVAVDILKKTKQREDAETEKG